MSFQTTLIPLNSDDIALLEQETVDQKFGEAPHFNLAWARYLLTSDSEYLQQRLWFYAALEYRLCIERYLFTLLVLVTGEDSVTRAQEKLYTGSDLYKAVTSAEPELLGKLRFTDLMFESYGLPLRASVPDLKKLSELHGRLGNYLHAQKRYPETVWSETWMTEFFRFLSICDSEMGPLLAPDRALAHFTPKGGIYQQWKDGILSDKTAIEAMRQEINGTPQNELS